MKKLLLLSVIIVSALSACTKFGEPSSHKLTAIKIDKDTMSMYVGETSQAPVITNPVYYSKDSLVYHSSDTSVLEFSIHGILTAKKVGVSTISISSIDNTISASALVTVKPVPTDSLKLGLVAYYNFSGNAADSSGNGFDGLSYNVTSIADRNGKPNAAYYFNGDTNSFIVVKDNSKLRLANTDFTINPWVKLVHLDDVYGAIMLSKRLPYSGQYGYQFSITRPSDVAFTPGTITFGAGGSFPVAKSNSVLDSATWHMVTVVYSITNHQAKIYKDGVLDGASGTDMTSPISTSDLYIGRDNPFVNKYFSLKGSLDDIRIYNRDLSDTEIGKLYILPN